MKPVYIVLIVGIALLLYFKPWRKKSKDYLNLTPLEISRIDYYMYGGEGLTYEEALNKVLLETRREYLGSSGWS